MPVFISHRTVDNVLAWQVYYRLYFHHNIKCYLDDLDKEARTTESITKVILKRLEECTHLVAVITPNTEGSWWVPFEIGVARRAPRIISSFTSLSDYQLPEYLKEWPVLRGEDAIDTFARIYKAGTAQIGTLLREDVRFHDRAATAQTFEVRIKGSLGQL